MMRVVDGDTETQNIGTKRKKVCSPNMDENCNGDACKRRMVVVIHNERKEQKQAKTFVKTPKINENCDGYDSKRRDQIFL